MSKYDWSPIPKEIEWIATDSDGIVFGFTSCPSKLYENAFSSDGFGKTFMMVGVIPFVGNWRDSLEERPK